MQEVLAASGDDQKTGEITTINSLRSEAKIALDRGDLDAAEKPLQQSLAMIQKYSPVGLQAAKILNSLGDVAQQRGMPPDAEKYYQQALAIAQKLDPGGPDVADSLQGLANVAEDRSDSSRLEKFTLESVAIRQRIQPDGLDVASSLNALGAVQIYHQDWDKAEQSYKQALAIQERLAPESLAEAETLQDLSNLLFFRQQYEQANQYHQRAFAIRQKVAPDTLAFASSLRWQGICTRNNPAEQEKDYRAALAIQERLAPMSLHVAVTLDKLSSVVQFRQDWVAAEKYERLALAIWEKLAPTNPQVTKIRGDLGNILVWRGDLAGAETFSREALEVNRRTNPVSYFVAQGLYSLGNITFQRGDLVASDDYYRQALEISEKIDPGGQLVARMTRGLGTNAENRGDLSRAEEYYRRALTIWQKIEPESNHVAQGLFTVGNVLHDRGELVQAEDCYLHALAIWNKVLPNSLFVEQDLGMLGQLALEKGELAKAEEYDRQAVMIQEKQGPGGPDLAQGLSALGDVLLARGDLAQAEESYRRALEIREKILPGTSLHAASLAAMAEIMRRKHQSDDAAQFYQQALDALEKQTATLGGGDELRAGFRAKHARYYQGYIDLLLEQKKPELAFQALERFRARTLLETLAMAHADIRKGVDPELLSRQRSLQELLTGKTQRRIQLLGARNRNAEIAVLDKEIRDLSSQVQELNDRIRAGSPAYAALIQPAPIGVKEAQEQLLDANTVLLEYSLSEERSHVWALTLDSVTTYELPKRSEIEDVARKAYASLTALQPASNNRFVRSQEGQHPDKLMASLSQMVLAPVAAQIKNANRLLIVSDGALQYIPFAALPLPSENKQAEPLLTRYEVVNLPSASVLAMLQQETVGRARAVKEVAVLADPVFDKNDARVAATPHRGPAKLIKTAMAQSAEQESGGRSAGDQLTRVMADVGTRGGPFLRRLPFSRREAKAILDVAPAGKGTQKLDFSANRAAAMSPDLSQYRVIHFATHGVLDSEHPELSGLIFSLVNSRGEPENGFLGLQDVYNLNLAADLVVLSACETGLGKQIQGEGLVGLTQGFMYAGAPQVIASLWSVDDAATAELMAHFYRALEKEGERPAAALRQAQIEIFKQERWRNPYYWAGFVIHGDHR